jgi:RND family efflux transporter MFP subunit
MKSKMRSLLSRFQKKRYYIPTIALVMIVIWRLVSGGTDNGEEIITVEATTFVQEVAVTGKVIAAKDVVLGFENPGRVSVINVKVGDKVSQGQVLTSLSNADAYATVLQRQARVDAEVAKLAEVRIGSRQEDINIAQSEYDGAVVAYEQAKQSLIDSIKDAYAKSDDALRSRIDQLYTNPRTVTPRIIPFDDYNLQMSLDYKRLRAGEILRDWSASLSGLNTSSFDQKYIVEARENMSFMRDFLNDLSRAVSALQTSGGMSQTTVDKYINDISSARSTVSASFTTLTSAEQSYKVALTTKLTKEQQLTLKRNGSTPEQIASQQAQLRSAQADLQSAQAAFSKTVIRAPFDGTITKVEVKEGEIVSTTVEAVSMISSAGYELESFISESDVSKVKEGQPARVTLDAYGRDIIFRAVVSHVDPTETNDNGISTYKTKLQFENVDDRVRSGMTANIVIQTAETPASVIIPQEALFLEGAEKVVTVDEAGRRVNRKVITGGINTQGQIEIIDGLVVGDRVVVKSN